MLSVLRSSVPLERLALSASASRPEPKIPGRPGVPGPPHSHAPCPVLLTPPSIFFMLPGLAFAGLALLLWPLPLLQERLHHYGCQTSRWCKITPQGSVLPLAILKPQPGWRPQTNAAIGTPDTSAQVHAERDRGPGMCVASCLQSTLPTRG